MLFMVTLLINMHNLFVASTTAAVHHKVIQTVSTWFIWQASGTLATFASIALRWIALEALSEFTITSIPATP
jgi:hypothetical protein